MDIAQVTDLINTVAKNLPWYLDAAIASGGLSAVFHLVYKKFSVESKVFKVTQIVAVCMFIPTAYYLLTTPIDDPAINALRGSLLFLGTQLWYYTVKYSRKYIADSYAKAKLLNEKKTAALPAVLAEPTTFSE